MNWSSQKIEGNSNENSPSTLAHWTTIFIHLPASFTVQETSFWAAVSVPLLHWWRCIRTKSKQSQIWNVMIISVCFANWIHYYIKKLISVTELEDINIANETIIKITFWPLNTCKLCFHSHNSFAIQPSHLKVMTYNI